MRALPVAGEEAELLRHDEWGGVVEGDKAELQAGGRDTDGRGGGRRCVVARDTQIGAQITHALRAFIGFDGQRPIDGGQEALIAAALGL